MEQPTGKVFFDQLDPNMRLPEREGTDDGGLRAYSPLQPPFHVAGFGWFAEERVYNRLPLAPRLAVREPVRELAACTAGGQIRFRTDSRRLTIRVRLRGGANMYHMPATGQCGFDCYLESQGSLYYHGTVKYDRMKTAYESVLFALDERELRGVTLHFPLYQAVEEVQLLLEPDAAVLPPAAYAGAGKVIVYGTSITQGGCASRPGMAYTNIMSRRLPYEFVNLGFSGNGRGEPELAGLIADIADPACLVLDYDGNCPDAAHVARTLPAFIALYRRRHSSVPILVVSKVRYAKERWDAAKEAERLKRRDIQRETVERLRREGDGKVVFLDGSDLLGDDYEECTVDGSHPTDLGFLRLADGLTPVVARLLGHDDVNGARGKDK
ncbi:MAG: SGNH/GDSL hydrolase family protein [Paenibacillaceae bacterium]|nr:SGNH/GDSL hydrolase family protein [Paenibacillaceae bacterium]